MPASTNRFIRKTLSFVVAGGALILLLSASSLWLVFITQNYVDSSVQARRVRAAAIDLLLSVQTAESGQRGFLLTQNETFLAPYQVAIQEVSQKMDALTTLLAANPQIVANESVLKIQVNAKLAEMKRTLELAKSGSLPEAFAVVRNESGMALMGDIRATLRSLIATAEDVFTVELDKQRRAAIWLKFVTVIATITIVLLSGAVATLITRFIRDLLRARSDMTELNLTLEARVRERTEDVMRANQEIQRYAYIVTHDLRSPLVNIMGFTSELQKASETVNTYLQIPIEQRTESQRKVVELAVTEDLQEAITFIRSSTRKMDGLINAILKISRDGRRPLKPEKINLEELMAGVVEAFQYQLNEAGARVDMHIDAKTCISDRFSLEQIFTNLFDNAFKYRDLVRPLELSITIRPDKASQIIIEVADNGRGIAEADLERIFELFRRAGKQDKPGEGIGLAHVRSLLGNLGGDISVKSNLGQYTKFMMRIPANLSTFLKSENR